MASMQCSKPGEKSQQQKHDQHQQDHCFGHMSDKIKGVFRGHHHAQPPAPNANCGQCKPGPKKSEHHKNKEGGFLNKIKDAFSDHSDSSDSDDDGHKAHHKRKN